MADGSDEYYATCGYCGRPEGFAVVADAEMTVQRLECKACGARDAEPGREI